MKRAIKFLLGAIALLLASLALWQGLAIYKEKPRKIVVKEEKPFVVIIPSYNNQAYCEKNLRSVFDQKYTNFRVIYIDDCSTDETYFKIKDLIEKSGRASQTTLIRNEKNCGALANFYRAIHTCRDGEIIVALDGDDFLAHEEVLTKLNRVYADEQVWMTYGNYLDYPSYKQEVVTCKKIPDAVVRKNSFRQAPWVSSHLRTFYAGLFKRIREEDLRFQGRFYPMAGDLAMMYPLLEMSGRHTRFIAETLYLYNRMNPLNDHKVNFALQQACAEQIRQAKPYSPLQELAKDR